MKHEKGFNLIELLIVVALIGILSAIAIPQYSQHVIKSNRAAVEAFMMDVANRQKQYLLDARTYAPALTTLAITTPTEVAKNYAVTICLDSASTSATCATPSSPPYFKITATPVSGSKQENDGALTLTDAGVKGPAGKW